MVLNNSEKRQRGAPVKLTDEWKRAIASKNDKHPNWSAQKILDIMQRSIRETLSGRDKDEIQREIDKLPGISTIGNYLKEIRSPDNTKPCYLDLPWSHGFSVEKEKEVHPDALPYVYLVQQWAEKNKDMWGQPLDRLTLRQALWINRLYGYFTRDKKTLKKKDIMSFIASYLYNWSKAYADRERICKRSKTPFDTTQLDKMFSQGGNPLSIADGETILVHYPDGSIEFDTRNEDLLRQSEEQEDEQ